MKNRRSISSLLAVAATYCFLFSLIPSVAAREVEHTRALLVHEGIPRDDAGAAAAFEAIVPVLHHPRCMNCHSAGDFPRQGDNSHPHTMQIRRGSDGQSANAVRCRTCHQDHNLAGLHMPPGAPDWHLPVRCLDWTERRHHLAGTLGCALYKQFRELRWLIPIRDTRVVRVTLEGRTQVWRLLGIPVG